MMARLSDIAMMEGQANSEFTLDSRKRVAELC